MIEHPTFLYRESPGRRLALTWWVDGKQHAVQATRDNLLLDDKLGHQYLLEQFVDWVNER